MSRWNVLFVVIALSGTCRSEMSSNQLARVREGLIRLGTCGYWYRLGCIGGDINLSYINDSFDISFFRLVEREGLMSVFSVLPEVKKLALEADAHLASDNPGTSEEDWGMICSRMHSVLGDKGGYDHELPTIERLALTAQHLDNRVDAIRAYISICRFDSLTFVQRAMEGLSKSDSDGLNARFLMLQALCDKMDENKVPNEKIETFCLYLLKQAETEKHAPFLVLSDKFLLKHIPEYAHSWQRLGLVSKRCLENLSGQSYRYFVSAGAEILSIPSKERADLRRRFPGLSPLPEMPDEAFEPPLDDAAVARKMKETVIPDVRFGPPATIVDAVGYFKYASRDYDDAAAPGERKGVDFVLRFPDNGNFVTDFGENGALDELWWKHEFPALCLPVVYSNSLHELLVRVCDMSGMTFKIKNGRVIVFPTENIRYCGGSAMHGITAVNTRAHRLLLVGGEPDTVIAQPEKADRRFDFITGYDPCDCCCKEKEDKALQPIKIYLRTANLAVTPKNDSVATGCVFTVTGVAPSPAGGSDVFTWRTGCHYSQGAYTVIDLKPSFAGVESDGTPNRVFVGQTNVIHILTDIPPFDGLSRKGTLSFDNGAFVSGTILVKNCLRNGEYDVLPSEISESDWFLKYARGRRYTAELLYVATDSDPKTRMFKMTYSLPDVGSVSTSLKIEVTACQSASQKNIARGLPQQLPRPATAAEGKNAGDAEKK